MCAWASSPDGSQFDYFIENWGAGVVFTSGVIEANNMNAGPLKGYVLDSARGVCVLETWP
ncbi:putative tail fiber protein [Klebsiella phage KA]|uniref:Tail fiber protein n=1 Tax=Klebsiella phage KA TaxID=3109000 RepID=A0ABZ1A146_9CAUD|nr:putative tail fiber protein [Klebsiella phage KA]